MLPLKIPTDPFIRTAVPVFAIKQSGYILGMYIIGVTSDNITIETISGAEATIERTDDSKVTITFASSSIWSDGVYICREDLLSE